MEEGADCRRRRNQRVVRNWSSECRLFFKKLGSKAKESTRTAARGIEQLEMAGVGVSLQLWAVYLCVCLSVCELVPTWVCASVYASVCVCLCVLMPIYLYVHVCL